MAIEEAKRAQEAGEVPVGCIVVRDGEILASARNEREVSSDPAGHAEILALREAGRRMGSWRLCESTVYCTLEPCCMCAGAMINARVKRLVYGLADPKSGACGSVVNIPELKALNHSMEVRGGMMQERVLEIMQEFFRSRR